MSYQTCLKMAATVGTQAWLMSLVFLPIGITSAMWAAFPAATGTGVPAVDTLVGMSVTVAGLVGSLAMGTRALAAQKQVQLWRNAAREIEPQLGVELLKREQALLNGEAVTVAGERLRLTSFERSQKFNAFHVFYGLFTVVFAFLLMANFLRLGRAL